MRKFWRIFRHEYFRHVLRWRFLMALLSLPLYLLFMLAMMAITVMVQFDRAPIGYIDQAGLIRNQDLPDSPVLPFLDAPLQSFDTEEAARAALEAKRIQGYYILPADFESTRSARLVYRDEAPGANATGKFARLVRLNLLAGQPPAVALRVTEGATLSFETVSANTESQPEGAASTGAGKPSTAGGKAPGSPAEGDPAGDNSAAGAAANRSTGPGIGGGGLQEMAKMVAPLAAAIFLFSAVLTSSGYLMQAVVDEKENRTMEILATSASPAIIMNGKISALICVGLTQMLFWIAPPAALLLLARASLPALPAVPLEGRTIVLLFGTVLPTFVMISALMATIGASVTEAREGQQVMSLFNLLLMSPFFVAVSILARPDGPIALALSFFPLTASLTLLMRTSFSTVPNWQAALSIAILVLCAIGALWFSGRVFRLGMLNYGKRMSWCEIFRAAFPRSKEGAR